MRRKQDATTAGAGDEILEVRLPFDIDKFGALVDRLPQDPSPLVFGAFEAPAFPGRPARQDHRPLTSGQSRLDIRVAHGIEPQLDQVGALHAIARLTKRRRCRRRHGDTKQRLGRHVSSSSSDKRVISGPATAGPSTSKKKPLQPFGLKRLEVTRSLVARSGQGDSLFWSAPIPPRGRKGGRTGEAE